MDYTDIFQRFISGNEKFKEACELVERNSHGRIWLIGGFLYRGIARQIYGSAMPQIDFDFLVDRLPNQLSIEHEDGEWKAEVNSFGNPKLVGKDYSVDVVPLHTAYSIVSRNLYPCVENFLTGTPLNIQSMVYDVRKGEVNGSVGFEAMKRREVAVNHKHFAEYASSKKGISVEEMVKKKADSLGFKAVFLESK